MATISIIGNRETVADSLAGFSADHQAWVVMLMENAGSDDLLLDGLHLYLDKASEARFLNSLKLQTCGEWLETTLLSGCKSGWLKRPNQANIRSTLRFARDWSVQADWSEPTRRPMSDPDKVMPPEPKGIPGGEFLNTISAMRRD